MKASQILKSGTEHAHQVALFNWAAIAQSKGIRAADDWMYYEIQPDPKAPFGLEPHPLDVKVWALKWMHAIPNGGSRGDDAKTRAIRGGQLKAEGVKSGVADVFMPVCQYRAAPLAPHAYNGLYIEMKKPGGRVSEEQDEFAAFVKKQQFKHVVCYGCKAAIEVIHAYMEYV